MTGPIKPPSTPGGATPASPVDSARETGRADFREEALTVPDRPGAAPEAASSLEPALAAIAKELREGRLQPSQAVDALVERVLQSPMARTLAPAARAQLETVVRAQLADDPALSALVADLGRGR